MRNGQTIGTERLGEIVEAAVAQGQAPGVVAAVAQGDATSIKAAGNMALGGAPGAAPAGRPAGRHGAGGARGDRPRPAHVHVQLAVTDEVLAAARTAV